MSVQRHSIPSKDADLETTAELPVLDVAVFEANLAEDRTGSTDTWHMPALQMPAGAQAPADTADEHTLQLEVDLRALSASLRDVEERLTRKGERLVELERELANARTERIALDERAAALILAAEEQAAARISAVEERAASAAAELGHVRTELSAEQTRATKLQLALEERDSAARTHQTRDRELQSQLAARDKELLALRRDLRDSESRAGQHLESLHTLEGRRVIFDGQLLNLEGELRDREAEVVELQRELALRTSSSRELEIMITRANERLAEQATTLVRAAEARTELETQLAAGVARIEQLERDLGAARSESAERAAATLRVEAERDEQTARLAATDARAFEVERRAEDQAERILQLQKELTASLDRASELEGDLRAAEDAINRLEAELRTQGAKLDELTHTQEEWRGTIESARNSLAERDSLIHRLEAEAANSATLLGNIQQSIRRLDPASQSGAHEIAPEGAVRLLIRVDGDTEVVHVLGRKTTVGRTPDNDLQIDAKFISRNHAVVLAGPNHTIIEDLNSTNGVAVNGRRITRHTLRDGDIVAIGKTTFRFAVRPTIERR